MDREFYGRIADGMRIGLMLTIVVSGCIAIVSVRLRHLFARYRERNIIVVILMISVLLQIVLMLWLNPPPFSDSMYYVDHARRLAQTGSYSGPDGELTAFWPVGYPALLAFLHTISGDMLLTGRIVNILSSVLIILITRSLFANELDREERLLLVAVLAFHPMILFGASPLMTEQVFLVGILGVMLLLTRNMRRWWNGILMGLLLAGASFLRPAGLLFAVALVFVPIAHRRFRTSTILTVIVIVAALAPWTIRNARTFGHFVPIATNGGFNFLMGNHRDASGGLNFDFQYPNGEINEAEASRIAYAQAWEDICSAPFDALLRLPMKLAYSYRRGDAAIIWSIKPVHTKAPNWLLAFFFLSGNLFWYVIVGVSILALIVGRGGLQSRFLRTILLSVAAAVFLIVFVYVGGERYVFPLLPIHAFLFVRFFRRSS